MSALNIGVVHSVLFFLFRLLKLDLVNYQHRFLSDFVDAVKKDNIVIVLCGLLYLYFVCLSPALTFGALLGYYSLMVNLINSMTPRRTGF